MAVFQMCERLNPAKARPFRRLTVVVLGSVAWLSAATLATAQPNHDQVSLSSLGPFPGSVAIADFDADGDPDVARADRAFGLGRAYEVNLEFTRESVPDVVLSVAAESPIALEAIDIDRDRDVDLIVSPILGGRVAGVFLNDGSGQFTAGDHTSQDRAAARARNRVTLYDSAPGGIRPAPDWPRPAGLSRSRPSYVPSASSGSAQVFPHNRYRAPRRTVIIRGPPGLPQ
jgi:hypothetical protein